MLPQPPFWCLCTIRQLPFWCIAPKLVQFSHVCFSMWGHFCALTNAHVGCPVWEGRDKWSICVLGSEDLLAKSKQGRWTSYDDVIMAHTGLCSTFRKKHESAPSYKFRFLEALRHSLVKYGQWKHTKSHQIPLLQGSSIQGFSFNLSPISNSWW